MKINTLILLVVIPIITICNISAMESPYTNHTNKRPSQHDRYSDYNKSIENNGGAPKYILLESNEENNKNSSINNNRTKELHNKIDSVDFDFSHLNNFNTSGGYNNNQKTEDMDDNVENYKDNILPEKQNELQNDCNIDSDINWDNEEETFEKLNKKLNRIYKLYNGSDRISDPEGSKVQRTNIDDKQLGKNLKEFDDFDDDEEREWQYYSKGNPNLNTYDNIYLLIESNEDISPNTDSKYIVKPNDDINLIGDFNCHNIQEDYVRTHKKKDTRTNKKFKDKIYSSLYYNADNINRYSEKQNLSRISKKYAFDELQSTLFRNNVFKRRSEKLEKGNELEIHDSSTNEDANLVSLRSNNVIRKTVKLKKNDMMKFQGQMSSHIVNDKNDNDNIINECYHPQAINDEQKNKSNDMTNVFVKGDLLNNADLRYSNVNLSYSNFSNSMINNTTSNHKNTTSQNACESIDWDILEDQDSKYSPDFSAPIHNNNSQSEIAVTENISNTNEHEDDNIVNYYYNDEKKSNDKGNSNVKLSESNSNVTTRNTAPTQLSEEISSNQNDSSLQKQIMIRKQKEQLSRDIEQCKKFIKQKLKYKFLNNKTESIDNFINKDLDELVSNTNSALYKNIKSSRNCKDLDTIKYMLERNYNIKTYSDVIHTMKTYLRLKEEYAKID